MMQKQLSGSANQSKESSNTAIDYAVSTLQGLLTIITSKLKKLNDAVKNYIDEHSSRPIDHALSPT